MRVVVIICLSASTSSCHVSRHQTCCQYPPCSLMKATINVLSHEPKVLAALRAKHVVINQEGEVLPGSNIHATELRPSEQASATTSPPITQQSMPALHNTICSRCAQSIFSSHKQECLAVHQQMERPLSGKVHGVKFPSSVICTLHIMAMVSWTKSASRLSQHTRYRDCARGAAMSDKNVLHYSIFIYIM